MEYKPYTYKRISRFYPVYHVFFEEQMLFELSGCTESFVKRYIGHLNGAWYCGYSTGMTSSTVQQDYEKFKILLSLRNRLRKALQGDNNGN